MATTDMRETEKAFLKACQGNDLARAQELLVSHPGALEAKSVSKGYGPMHWAAMGGATEVIEWLDSLHVDPECANPDGITPLHVALEYKRLDVARRLQQLRDTRKNDPDGTIAAAQAAARQRAAEEHARQRAEAEAEEARHRAEAEASAARERARQRVEAEAAEARNQLAKTTANREAASQALAAGRRALRNGDLTKGLKMLRKANMLSPHDGEIEEALGAAEREMDAVLKEQRAEEAAAKQDAAEQQQMWNHPSPPPMPPKPPKPPPAKRAATAGAGGSSGNHRAAAASGSSPAPAATPRPSEYRSSSSPPPARPDSPVGAEGSGSSTGGVGGAVLRCVMLLLGALTWLARMSGLAMVCRLLLRLPGDTWKATSEWLGRRYDSFLPDPTAQENLAYLGYYWRARLRWPFRLVGVLLLLLLAWRFPWQAYAIFVLGAAGGVTYFSQYLPYVAALKTSIVGVIAAAVVLLCYVLPYTTAWMLGITALGGITYLSWQIGAGLTALLLLFSYLPTTAMALLGAAAWLLLLLILPRINLFATEFGLGTYYFPFHWPFLHVVLLCVLFSNLEVKALVPMGILCAVLYFFPRIVLSLIGLFILWMLWPIIAQGKTLLLKLTQNPYATGDGSTMPEKVKTPEHAAEVATSGKSHYEVLHAHRGATPSELKGSYKRMALLLHPDKNPGADAADAFKKVSDAFTVLGDAYERAEYDAALDNGQWAEEDAGGETTDDPIRQPDDMPSGPPGLKKRKPRPRKN